MGARYSGGRSDLSEWPRSTDAKERRRRRQMSGTATGIVRRVDDLGRIVIPKEIRRTLKIREGRPLSYNIYIRGAVQTGSHEYLHMV
jgi:DNA-binding transcriptional regulator/RsmH inhibitor MraZ